MWFKTVFDEFVDEVGGLETYVPMASLFDNPIASRLPFSKG